MLEEGTKVTFSNFGKKLYGTISKVNMKFPGIHSGKSTYEIKGKDGNLYKDVLPRYVFKKRM